MPNWRDWLIRRTPGQRPGVAAHITFGQTSIGRTMSRTGLILRRQLWIWPIVAVVVLATLGYGIKRAIQSTMESTLRSELQTLLTVERSMLEKWLQVQESGALALANSRPVRDGIGQLLEIRSDAALHPDDAAPADRRSHGASSWPG